jgi:hypothetical protein
MSDPVPSRPMLAFMSEVPADSDPREALRALRREIDWKAGPDSNDPIYRYVRALERRVAQLEGGVRKFAKATQGEPRTDLLVALCGRVNARRIDRQLLTPAEARLVDQYRRSDEAGRMALRRVVARVAAGPAKDETERTDAEHRE